eukprot:scaffold28930_cov19-Tisochrysis_lutea.AAC.3
MSQVCPRPGRQVRRPQSHMMCLRRAVPCWRRQSCLGCVPVREGRCEGSMGRRQVQGVQGWNVWQMGACGHAARGDSHVWLGAD